MNIFKVLASGGGNISENNVSAFLGYLLDPSEDHGLKTRFLERFLSNIILQSQYYEWYKEFIVDDNGLRFIKGWSSKFDVGVKMEERVEYNEEESQKRRNNRFDLLLSIQSTENSDIIHHFIIENKINDKSINGKDGQQLITQVKSLKNDLLNKKKENTKTEKISSIFVTPKNEVAKNYYKCFTEEPEINSTPKCHIFWGDDDKSIYGILRNILKEEAEGLIEPLQDYSKHTIKAFMNFIKEGFKSYQEDKALTNNSPKYYDSLESLYPKKGSEYERLRFHLDILKSYDSLSFDHTPTHPLSVILQNKRQILSIQKSDYVFMTHTKSLKHVKSDLVNILENKGITYRIDNEGIVKANINDINIFKEVFDKYLEVINMS